MVALPTVLLMAILPLVFQWVHVQGWVGPGNAKGENGAVIASTVVSEIVLAVVFIICLVFFCDGDQPGSVKVDVPFEG